MNDDAEQPERVGSIELVDERRDGLPAKRSERRREVDQVTGV